jgi:cell division ATPase FtsA
MHRIGLVDVGCYHTEFASECASSGMFQTIIRVGSVHVTNDISIGLPTPIARAEKPKRRFGLGHNPEIDPNLESQVQDADLYREIVGARVSETLALLERQFPNDLSIRDLTGGL